MIKKLVRHGNSLALVIDKAILDLLRIDHDTPLELITDGDVIVIKPERDEEVSDEIRACLLYTSPSPRDRTRSRMPSSA